MLQRNVLRKYNSRSLVIALVVIALLSISCKKYLDQKPRQNLRTPSSLSDLQAILDLQKANQSSPGYLEFVADNYYFKSSIASGLFITERLSYIWDRDAYATLQTIVGPYGAIYESNFVLDLLTKVSMNENEKDSYNNIKGTALFYRAFLFYQVAQLFCKPYDPSTADTDMGIMLRLTANVTEVSTRSTVKQTYGQIIADLKTAFDLLPTTTQFSTRPTKAAVYGMLARVYLSMNDYALAGQFAKSCLELNSNLLTYASITSLPLFVINPEIIFMSNELSTISELTTSRQSIIDSNLMKLYSVNDLRKTIFFDYDPAAKEYHWKGTYFPDYTAYGIFDGIATDEIYLIRAECLARAGNTDSAMLYLNTLLRNRHNASFTDLDNTDALDKILTERRKELVFRGLRWSDIRRLNVAGANITLTRVINGNTYTLPPNDLRSVLLIPSDEINRSGIPQNPR